MLDTDDAYLAHINTARCWLVVSCRKHQSKPRLTGFCHPESFLLIELVFDYSELIAGSDMESDSTLSGSV